ncbi:MAG: sugar phosphate isomerase/epimerase family protein [Spirochaetota bacterium]
MSTTTSNVQQDIQFDPSKVKLAVMHLTWNIPVNDDFVPWLEEVKAAGYDGITSFSHWGLDSFIDRPKELGELLDDHGLELAAVDIHLDKAYDEYKRVFEFMQALECRLMVCIDPSGDDRDSKKYAAMLNAIGEMALDFDVQVHYHNHTNSVGETLTDVEKLMSELDFTKVSLMLDVGHATKDFAELEPPGRAAHFLEKHWDQLNYLELKDWSPETDLNTPLGEGVTDYRRIFELMRKRGYRGWLTVEQNGNDGLSKGRSPLTCAKISREFIRENLGV